MSWLVPLVSLTLMEIVLGIDNIIFISIICGRLPEAQREKARLIGLGAAMGTRLLLLFSLSIVMSLTYPVFELSDLGIPRSVLAMLVPGHGEQRPPGHGLTPHTPVERPAPTEEEIDLIDGISIKDLILLVGGLFLIFHSIMEIHHKLEGEQPGSAPVVTSFASAITQIAALDLIFSLDSVITAVGMANQIWVMVLAVVISVGVMLAFSGYVSRFVDQNPSIKILALSFLILIGVLLVAESIGTHFNKGYVYFAMAFSLIVELLNMRLRMHRLLPPPKVAAGPV